ncbi:pseudouridine synthase [Acidithiobacillus sp. AMEEHan]|uniref:pseudouridine synthase n=1 Tax=Acidithiobacillus sp. AMEEHan TaxID=2994951 RepID=UPI0027E591EB|nr:pseudouridine synthase [Acidithiobacillus sp. AMEEHan]
MAKAARFGLARILSKRGICSRTVAAQWIRAGRVSVAGEIILDPEQGFPLQQAAIAVDGGLVAVPERRVIMLHKPRGYLVTRSDTRGRRTVYELLPGDCWLAPVGRLDQASSGLLLFANDPSWAQTLLDPESHLCKCYHVQIQPPLEAEQIAALTAGPRIEGVQYQPMQVREIRCGGKTQWLEFQLIEGRNRQIRRLLASQDRKVLRLLRIAIGTLTLGSLRPGEWRELTPEEIPETSTNGPGRMRWIDSHQ